MNLITSSGGRFKRKRLQIWLYLHEISIQGSRIWQKSYFVIAIYIMEDSLTKVNLAINFSVFLTLSDILKHQVIL
jgi:hypothetical protein